MNSCRRRYCQQLFQPSRFHPHQTVCVNADCQRHQRRDYHRRKIERFPRSPSRFQFKVAPARQCRTPGQLMLYFRFPAASFCCGQECLSLRINNLLGYTPANLCFKSGQLML